MLLPQLNTPRAFILLDSLLAVAIAGLLIAQILNDSTQLLRLFVYSTRQDKLSHALQTAQSQIPQKLAELGCDQSFALPNTDNFSFSVRCQTLENLPQSRLCLANCEIRSADLTDRLPAKTVQFRQWSIEQS